MNPKRNEERKMSENKLLEVYMGEAGRIGKAEGFIEDALYVLDFFKCKLEKGEPEPQNEQYLPSIITVIDFLDDKKTRLSSESVPKEAIR